MKLQRQQDEVPDQVTEEVSAHGGEGEGHGPSSGHALNATHTNPNQPLSSGREDGLAQHGGEHSDKSREEPSDHGLHRAHAERKISRMDREREKEPTRSSP